MQLKMQLVAGPELDAEVAKAIGLVGGDILHGSFYVFRPELLRDFFRDAIGCAVSKFECGDDQREWSPSTDLNDAFDVAEKIGLFDQCQLTNVHCKWGIYSVTDEMLNDPLGGEHDTPALAICAAVLKTASRVKSACDAHSPERQ